MENADPPAQTEAKRIAKSPPVSVPLSERAALTPGEFAALFGKATTWGYRLCYSKKVKVIRSLGRMMIPRSEAERLLSEATEYVPRLTERARRKVKDALS